MSVSIRPLRCCSFSRPGRHLNTDEAVALGAGLRAGNLTSAVKGGTALPRVGLQDVAPYAVRASIVKGSGEVEVVKLGVALPAKKVRGAHAICCSH